MKFVPRHEEMRKWSDDTHVPSSSETFLIEKGPDIRFLTIEDLRFSIEANSGGSSIDNWH